MDIFPQKLENRLNTGYLVQGEATTLKLTAFFDETEQTVAAATFSTKIMGVDGTTVVIANADHAIVESLGTLTGQFNITLTAANSAKIKAGKPIQFQTAITIGAATKIYFGSLDEVRPQIL